MSNTCFLKTLSLSITIELASSFYEIPDHSQFSLPKSILHKNCQIMGNHGGRIRSCFHCDPPPYPSAWWDQWQRPQMECPEVACIQHTASLQSMLQSADILGPACETDIFITFRNDLRIYYRGGHFGATFHVNKTLIYRSYCSSLVLGGPLDMWSKPGVVFGLLFSSETFRKNRFPPLTGTWDMGNSDIVAGYVFIALE